MVAVDAAARRVVELRVTAVDIAHDMRRTQGHFAFGVEVRSVHEERPADPHILTGDGLAAPGLQVTVGQAQVTAYVRPVQGDYAVYCHRGDCQAGIAFELVSDDRGDPGTPFAGPHECLFRMCFPQVDLLEDAIGEVKWVSQMGVRQVEAPLDLAAHHADRVPDVPLAAAGA